MCLKKVIAIITIVLTAGGSLQPAYAADYFVRPDGGSETQCNGLADLPYPGKGEGQPCAWDHPFRALPPQGEKGIKGSDSLYIKKGSYMMGFGAPGAQTCSEDWPWDCRMASVPSGEDILHPTRILGEGWERGCDSPPELWGTERSYSILDLTGSTNVVVACLEITDHEGCSDSHSGGAACERNIYPYGKWSQGGITASDSANVTLQDLNIHGLSVFGVLAGRLRDWTLEDVRIAGNGWVGWDGDIGEDCSNSGAIIFRRCTIEWNGCVETYPEKEPSGCWAQSAGGYGDGIGTGATGGDWIFEDTAIIHNTSDGLDLLYHSLGGTITLNRVWAEGNAGNQVKVTGNTAISNCLLVGNCAFFENKPFTFNVDACRALGNTLEAVFTGGDTVEMNSSTICGQGDGLVGGGVRKGFSCLGNEILRARNSIFLGDTEYLSQGGDETFLFYQEGCATLSMDSDFNIIHKVKSVSCGTHNAYVTSGANDLCVDPLLEAPFSGIVKGFVPCSQSPAVDSADHFTSPTVDMRSVLRPLGSKPDRGALERICGQSLYVAQEGICGELSPCYKGLGDALLAAPSEATLFLTKGAHEGHALIDLNKTLTLYPGCMTDFSFCTSKSYLQNLILQKGSLNLLGEVVLSP